MADENVTVKSTEVKALIWRTENEIGINIERFLQIENKKGREFNLDWDLGNSSKWGKETLQA